MYKVNQIITMTKADLIKSVRAIKFEYIDEEIDVGQGVMFKTGKRIKKYDATSERYYDTTVEDQWKKEGAMWINDNMILHPHDGSAILYIIVDESKASRKKREDD